MSSITSPSAVAACMTVQGVAARLNVAVATVYKWVRAGLMPAPYRLGTATYRWDRDRLEAWLASQREGGADVEV